MGELIQLPVAQRSCNDCVFLGTTYDGASFCGRFAEEILFESVAEDCPEWTHG